VMHAARSAAEGSRPVAPLWPLFRVAAQLGLFHRYLNRQRRCHTLVSSLHGPEHQVTLADATVSDIIPLAVADAGNVSVSFDVLSYAGTVTVTAIADPDCVPDLDLLREALHVELTKLTSGQPYASPTNAVQSHRREDAQRVR
jgi:diacylglycerol O-acyltransferase / wax synthase